MTVKTKPLILIFSLILGITALILTLTLIPKSQETRRRAAEVAPICWNVVREFESKPQWPNGCKGNPTPQYCTQALVPLTDEETAIYSAWVDAGKPAIKGCTLVEIRGPLTGDINQDRIVDVIDYSLFVGQFLHTGTGLTADFNQDNIADVSDYSLLVANFLKTVP